jgi:nicotinamide-nucleotide adenylyltransferase
MNSAGPELARLLEALDELRGNEHPTLVVPELDGDPRSVALLPGSFDPITIGHAALAEVATQNADLVLLVYSVRTLPKEGEPPPALLGEPERLRSMVEFSRGRPGLQAALASHGLLAEQAEAARVRFPHARLFVVMGSDKVPQLLDPRWYRDRDAVLDPLFADAEVLYADRSGHEGVVEKVLSLPENRRWSQRFRRLQVSPEVASVSSREVRERSIRGEDVRQLVPIEVHPFLPSTR